MNKKEQEARKNLVDFFFLLWETDQRLKNKKKNEKRKKHN